jgi:hypothetical protein
VERERERNRMTDGVIHKMERGRVKEEGCNMIP